MFSSIQTLGICINHEDKEDGVVKKKKKIKQSKLNIGHSKTNLSSFRRPIVLACNFEIVAKEATRLMF